MADVAGKLKRKREDRDDSRRHSFYNSYVVETNRTIMKMSNERMRVRRSLSAS